MVEEGEGEMIRRVGKSSSEELRERNQSEKDKSVMESKEDLTGFNALFGVTQVTGGLLCVLVLAWNIKFRNGFGWSADPASQFNWHPLLMTIGMVYLYANSIMIYRSLRNMRKKQLKLFHAGIHTTILLLIIIAQVAVISFHNANNIPNFYSLHSWIGIITMLIFFMQYIAGLVAFLYPGLSPPLRAAILPLHVYFGLAGFVLAVATCISGLLEKAIFVLGTKYGALPGEAVMVNIIGLLFVVFGLLVVYIVSQTSYKRYPRPEDNVLLTGVAE